MTERKKNKYRMAKKPKEKFPTSKKTKETDSQKTPKQIDEH